MKGTRRCTVCGEGYWRVNAVGVWVVRVEGKRAGWVKQVEKVCTRCLSAEAAQRLVRAAQGTR